ETITLDTSTDQSVDEEKNTDFNGEVSLMTVHGAKGLEFQYVYLSGVEENIFPSFRSLEDGDQAIEEERRLFYVAMTRAMKRLYLTFAQGRMLFGQLKFNGPSRYIDEIPPKYYVWHNKAKQKNDKNSYNQDGGSDFENYSQENPYGDDEPVIYRDSQSSSTYPKGSSVIHSLYGEGRVLEVEGSGSDEKVLINFLDGTKKRFMVKFAPLSSV
ncbi:ATP-dependent DNA helicase, partial [bacterium]|nr:ATP-dependent DNA helicase [bacterium]